MSSCSVPEWTLRLFEFVSIPSLNSSFFSSLALYPLLSPCISLQDHLREAVIEAQKLNSLNPADKGGGGFTDPLPNDITSTQ